MTFARLRLADWVALIAGLALLFATAADWYSTTSGDEARRIEGLTSPAAGGEPGQVESEVREDARLQAEAAERNAWQVSGAIDRLILIGIIATTALTVTAAFMRAAGRRYGGGISPSLLAGVIAAVTALLVTYRIVQEPGFDASTVVKAGAPIALVLLGVVAFCSATAARAEEAGTEFRELPEAGAGTEIPGT
jgi:hypothetical protein